MVGRGLSAWNTHVTLRTIAIVGKSAVRVLGREYVAHTSAQGEPNVRSAVIKTFIKVDEDVHRINILARTGISAWIETAICVLETEHSVNHSLRTGQRVILVIINQQLVVSAAHSL